MTSLKVLDDYSMIELNFYDYTDEETIQNLLLHVDRTLQYGEDADV